LQGVLDSRKELFEELLWEYHGLVEAFTALQATHSQCQGLFEPTSFFCTGFTLMNCVKMFLYAAALPEASLDDLSRQVAALKGKLFPLDSFSHVVLLY
jgi:hypothetical protein